MSINSDKKTNNIHNLKIRKCAYIMQFIHTKKSDEYSNDDRLLANIRRLCKDIQHKFTWILFTAWIEKNTRISKQEALLPRMNCRKETSKANYLYKLRFTWETKRGISPITKRSKLPSIWNFQTKHCLHHWSKYVQFYEFELSKSYAPNFWIAVA